MSDVAIVSRSGFVALVGWTNVGKSTLLNRLVGTKLAAVADVAQTTRTRILGASTDPLRGQILYVDTPGLHQPKSKMNRNMVEVTQQAMLGVDCAVLVIDAARGPGRGDASAAEALTRSGAPFLVALNKVDRVRPKTKLLPMIEQADALGGEAVVPISGLTGEGCDRLVELLYARLPEGPPLYPEDYLTDQPERVLAAEWIREKLLERTRQELPHATAVLVEGWSEREDGLLRIEATILVERESHKRIVIGSEGSLLREVGSAARAELEAFLERRIFLQLWVKVRENWRNREAILHELGLG